MALLIFVSFVLDVIITYYITKWLTRSKESKNTIVVKPEAFL